MGVAPLQTVVPAVSVADLSSLASRIFSEVHQSFTVLRMSFRAAQIMPVRLGPRDLT